VPHHLPPFTAYRLPLAHRRQGPAAVLSLVAHGAIALAVLWRGAAWLVGGSGESGLPGGSEGGGRPAVSWFTLPTPSAPQIYDVPAAPVTPVAVLALPDPVHIDLPQLRPAAPVTTDAGTGGPGPGTGGQGTGTGTGSGVDSGSGSGGEGSYILPAEANGVIVPPACARGEFTIRFWVEVDGRVSRLEIDPLPRDAGCRRQMIETLKAYRFRPARTRDGRAVASIYPFKVTH
jgi:hypothetical protein